MDAQSGDGWGTLENVLSEIKKGKIAPCYLLYGEEEYLINDAFRKIIDLLLPDADRSLNRYSVDGHQENINDICLALLAAPLIPGKKIVAIKDTSLFQSKKILPALIKKIRDNLETNPSRAGSDFLRFLKLAGWKLEEFREGGWKRITDEEWQKNTQNGNGEDREKWLPKIVDLCVELGLKSATSDEDMESLSRAIAGGFPEGNYLILTAQEVDKRKQLFKQIVETGKALYFPRANKGNRQKFLLVERAQELLSLRGKKLSPDAWQAIGRKTGFDLRKSMAALEKLIVYTGEKPVIDAGDGEGAVGKTKEDTVFDLTTALLEKNLPQSLMVLQYLLEQGLHYLVIMKMITREIRLLLYAKLLVMSGKLESYNLNMDYSRFQGRVYPTIKALGGKEKDGIGNISGQHPYIIYKLLKSSEKFPYKTLVKYMEQLAEIDLSLRSTGKDPKLQLERFLAEVCLHQQ
jgi:DNA polymerase-3 subunit delta